MEWILLLVCIVLGIGALVLLMRYYQANLQHYQNLLLQMAVITHWQAHENHVLNHQLVSRLEDPITKLSAWSVFEDRLMQNIKEAERYQFIMGVLQIDVDDFNLINDVYGHAVSDRLLKEIALRLKDSIRKVDSVARLSKDTFVVILAQLAKAETAAIAAQRILQALKAPFIVNEQEITLTTCIGIAIYPTDGLDMAALLRSADQALLVAKKNGKHQYQFYQEKLHRLSQLELAFYTSLNKAELFQDFILYYQPIVDSKKEMVIAMDAMLHWKSEVSGLVQQEEFNPYAEKHGFSNEISAWLINEACLQYAHWNSLGFKPELIAVSIQLNQLENSHFVYRISQILQTHNFSPTNLLIEIKEGSTFKSISAIEKSFNMLNYLGVKIALDDFSAWSFPLRILKNINMHYLKIDPSLIDDVEHNMNTEHLVEALLYLANKMKMQVIVKGVERENQLQKLQALGCVLMQGRLLGKTISQFEIESQIHPLV